MPDRLEELQEKLKRFVEERDWHQFHNPTQLAMDISVEAGELLELFQWKMEKELPQVMKEKREKVEAELADVFLSCLKFSNHTGIDIMAAAEKKFAEMGSKYPADKVRGKNKKYDEY